MKTVHQSKKYKCKKKMLSSKTSGVLHHAKSAARIYAPLFSHYDLLGLPRATYFKIIRENMEALHEREGILL